MKVLIVDDSKTMRLIVKRAIRQSGLGQCDIDEAENGQVGLEKVQEWQPDLVLCDWNMPVMNGPELLKLVRAEEAPVAFGFITSESSPEFAKKARESGARFLITKPFTPDTIKKTLEPFFGQRGAA